jgi:hypothetical protein
MYEDDDVRFLFVVAYHSIVGIGFPDTVQLKIAQLAIGDSRESCFGIMTGGDEIDTSKACRREILKALVKELSILRSDSIFGGLLE